MRLLIFGVIPVHGGNSMKHWIRFLVLILCSAIFGCSQQTASVDDQSAGDEVGGQRTIGISVQTLQNPFFKLIADTVESEAGKHGWTVLKRDAEEKIEVQKDQVKEFIVKKVDAIVLCPRDSEAIGASVREANQAGIPVFTVDTVCADKEAEVVFHVGTDNFQGGEIAGQAMIDALGEAGGKVVVLEFKDVDSCIDRVNGFTKVVNAHNETAANKIEIVGHYDSKGNDELGQNATREALISNSDLAGIFAINDPAALGAYAALEAEGKQDSVVVIGFDGQPEGKVAVGEGKLFDTPTQFPGKMAVESVNAIVKYFDGEKIEPASMLILTAPYRKADADKDAAQ